MSSGPPTPPLAGDKPQRYNPLSPPLWIPAFAGMTNWGAGTIHFRTKDELGGRNDDFGGANDDILGGPAGWDLWWRWRRLLG